MSKAAYLILRLTVGASMPGHGLVRRPKLTAFGHGMVETFKSFMLPQALVISFRYASPFAEFGVGLCLLTSLLVRQALIAGAVITGLLLFGSCLIENWDAIRSQLIHAPFFAVPTPYPSTDTAHQLIVQNTTREQP